MDILNDDSAVIVCSHQQEILEQEILEREYEKVVTKNMQSIYQHKISDLIKILEDYLEKEGDLPMIYYGNECACKFESFSDFCSPVTIKLHEQEILEQGQEIFKQRPDKKVLMLGDFHVDGCSHLCKYMGLKYVVKKKLIS